MKCASCGNLETKVIDSRVIDNWKWIRRRRSCEYCNHRFTTLEKLIVSDLIVIKKDWTRELYDRDKIKRSLVIAFGKKHLSMDKIEEIISNLEAQRSWKSKEITSEQIWKDILRVLKDTNEVAYVRFASVFMEFDWVDDFGKFVGE